MNIPVKHPVQIYICNSLSDLQKGFRTAPNDESSKGPKPFLKAVVFCKPPQSRIGS